ncbi:MAG: hypothetical protein A2Y12_01435 [Planctomycetes bacterium GWF2_42_9]|nr:MAG: hypothetical protein A2Y12_01435 [Planctomycetes bacterium GWF2_42_9]
MALKTKLSIAASKELEKRFKEIEAAHKKEQKLGKEVLTVFGEWAKLRVYDKRYTPQKLKKYLVTNLKDKTTFEIGAYIKNNFPSLFRYFCNEITKNFKQKHLW